tara:strand:- start:320 stop:460 length:141 start_codon:yes stop_codon:yes gene_type:complete
MGRQNNKLLKNIKEYEQKKREKQSKNSSVKRNQLHGQKVETKQKQR